MDSADNRYDQRRSDGSGRWIEDEGSTGKVGCATCCGIVRQYDVHTNPHRRTFSRGEFCTISLGCILENVVELHGIRREMHHAHATPACLDEGVGPDGSDGSVWLG
jgi:hypothetical protein